MSGKLFFWVILLLFTTLNGIKTFASPQEDSIASWLWYNEEQTAKIQVYKAVDGKYYGKIVWLKVPNKDGRPKVDERNGDKTKRNDPILGLLILKGLKKEDENSYDDGTIYDPKNGKTYSCKVTRNGDKLSIRGYIGFSLIGRSATWTRAD